ncbi:MAG: hypothetical protein KUG69_15305 [Marinosulfonomonas sp.]|nr:hypothetical protein [Marinosulfonomonas sp.]
MALAIVAVLMFAVAWSPTNAGTGPSGLVTKTPARVLDTRGGPMPAAGSQLVVNTGHPGATAAVANITSVGATAPGQFLTAWASGPLPNSSVLNSGVGDTIANSIIVPLAPDGTFRLYTHAPAHLLVDISGYFDGGTALPPAGLTASITGYSLAGSITQVIGVAGNGTSDSSRLVRVEVNCPGGELETTSVFLGAFETKGWSVLCDGLHSSGATIRGIVDL